MTQRQQIKGTREKLLEKINSLLKPVGIELSTTSKEGKLSSPQPYDPASSYMKDQYLQTILIEELAAIASDFFATCITEIATSDFDFKSEIQHFWQIYKGRPFAHSKGGSGFHNSFWIYLFSRIIAPSLIVESGVWKGHMSWLLEQACPNANIHGFDINLSNLEYTSGKVFFHEQDWSHYQFQNVHEKSLAFFDCHVNHARRIIEAHSKGFRHLLFDDNPPKHKLYAYGLPGVPTANMVFNEPQLNPVDIAWYWQGNERVHSMNMEEISEARNLIERHETCPDVGGPTRYGGFSFLTYVRLSSSNS